MKHDINSTSPSKKHGWVTPVEFEKLYNQHIPQKALGGISPIQAMKNWQKIDPEIFTKNVYKQAGLDM